MSVIYIVLIAALLHVRLCLGLGSEWSADTYLTERDIGDFDSIKFGDITSSSPVLPTRNLIPKQQRCKTFPGDSQWPSDQEWQRLNVSLGGVLLKPVPPAAACYPSHPAFDAAACEFLLTNASRTSFYLDDPLTVGTQWSQGNTCLASRNPAGNCTQGGFPAYVVNATSVLHVQLAINFARNHNLRISIK